MRKRPIRLALLGFVLMALARETPAGPPCNEFVCAYPVQGSCFCEAFQIDMTCQQYRAGACLTELPPVE